MSIPDFFIVGAPKTGTTSLATYLMKHPDVYMPGRWEVNYLADDLKWKNGPVISSDDEYLSSFLGGKGEFRVGEKSAFYLYSTTAARRIHSMNSDAKIICMLRDPVDLIWSMYRYNVVNLEEDILSFEKALDAEKDRRQGRRIPENTTIVQNLFYRGIVQFPKQIRRYFSVFGAESVCTILLRDFASETQEQYRRVLSFLDLKSYTLETQQAQNESSYRDLQTLTLRRWMARQPKLKQVADALVPARMRSAVAHLWDELTGGVDDQLREMDSVLRCQLSHELRPMRDELATLLDRDLSHWCQIDSDV